jgi:hypothetical protein
MRGHGLRVPRPGRPELHWQGGSLNVPGWAQIGGWPLNCDVLPLNIKGPSRFLRK